MTTLLDDYDAQLRGAPELRGALRSERLGPLWLGFFADGFGFITHRGRFEEDPRDLIDRAIERFDADGRVRAVEWKTRAHDAMPGLIDALLAAGFEAGDPESIMIGEAAGLAQERPLPDGVTLRRVTAREDVVAASAMADRVFGDHVSLERAEGLLERLAAGGELWVAEQDGEIVSTGRLEPVPGTVFAGLWGGATRADHRHRGIYRALTAARARSAIARGVRLLQSDSTEYSRPILERSGFVKVSETTPYERRR